MEYEVVNRRAVPTDRWGKWKFLFDDLALDKAIKLTVSTKKEAGRVGRNVSGCLRHSRSDYKLSYRVIPDGNSFSLFLWKVPRC